QKDSVQLPQLLGLALRSLQGPLSLVHEQAIACWLHLQRQQANKQRRDASGFSLEGQRYRPTYIRMPRDPPDGGTPPPQLDLPHLEVSGKQARRLQSIAHDQ